MTRSLERRRNLAPAWIEWGPGPNNITFELTEDRHAFERVCLERGCWTVLRTSNPSSRCSVHERRLG